MTRSNLQLYDFRPTKLEYYTPYPCPRQFLAPPPEIPSTSGSGSRTPLPASPLTSSTPAWDPSSQTPSVLPATLFPPASSSTLPEPNDQTAQVSRHPFLSQRLSGVKFKALADGKLITVYTDNGTLWQLHNKRALYIDITKVHPKHPNPTRDNGLCVVMEGEHCGKYVRRLYFQKSGGENHMRVVVVLRKGAKEANEIGSPPEIHVFAPGILCMCDETADERKGSDRLLEDLRKAAAAEGRR